MAFMGGFAQEVFSSFSLSVSANTVLIGLSSTSLETEIFELTCLTSFRQIDNYRSFFFFLVSGFEKILLMVNGDYQ